MFNSTEKVRLFPNYYKSSPFCCVDNLKQWGWLDAIPDLREVKNSLEFLSVLFVRQTSFETDPDLSIDISKSSVVTIPIDVG